jgi:hypothetical protein
LAFKYRFTTPFEVQEININSNTKNNNINKLENKTDLLKYNSLFKGVAVKKKIKLDIKNYKD